MSRIAIIPARAGSKRIPRKNVKKMAGKPLIAWPIKAAIQSSLFDRIIVSTDDQDIANLSASLGAEIPFLRPIEIADDHTGTLPVVQHALEELSNTEHEISEVCCIYATAALLRQELLVKGLDQLKQTGADYVIPITRYSHPIERALKADGYRIEMIDQQSHQMRTQDCRPRYHDTGQFYWGTSDAWFSGRPFFGSNSSFIEVASIHAHDIDTQDDWHLVETLLKHQQTAEC